MAPASSKYDVVIAAGGIIGSYIACHLKMRAPAIEVAVVEPDPAYAFASTPRASGGARRLFSCPENIAMSNYGIERIRNFAVETAVDGETPSVDWVQQGYLFIVSGAPALTMLEENAQQQCALGADVRMLDRAGLRALL